MDVGFNLDKLTYKTNTLLAPFILTDMTMNLGSSICWAYFSVIIFFRENVIFDDGLFSVTSFLFALFSIVRVLRKSNLAEMYLCSRSDALEEFQKLALENYGKFDRRLKWKLEVLEERLTRENAFSPYDSFNLNRGAFIPSVASVITYFIIIIQFKISEVPDDLDPWALPNITIPDPILVES